MELFVRHMDELHVTGLCLVHQALEIVQEIEKEKHDSDKSSAILLVALRKMTARYWVDKKVMMQCIPKDDRTFVLKADQITSRFVGMEFAKEMLFEKYTLSLVFLLDLVSKVPMCENNAVVNMLNEMSNKRIVSETETVGHRMKPIHRDVDVFGEFADVLVASIQITHPNLVVNVLNFKKSERFVNSMETRFDEFFIFVFYNLTFDGLGSIMEKAGIDNFDSLMTNEIVNKDTRNDIMKMMNFEGIEKFGSDPTTTIREMFGNGCFQVKMDLVKLLHCNNTLPTCFHDFMINYS